MKNMKDIPPAELLVEIAKKNADLFLSTSQIPYAIIQMDNQPKQAVELMSERFKMWLTSKYWDMLNATISTEAENRALKLLKMLAHKSKRIMPVPTRIFEESGNLYYDLNDEQGRMVTVNSNGVLIENNAECKIAFHKDANLSAQVLPDLSATAPDLLEIIPKLFRIGEEQSLLLIVYLVCCFIPNMSHPILVIHGEKGSAKSSTLRMLTQIINPNLKGLLSMPQIADLPVVLHNNYFLAFDNMCIINKTISNMLCQAVTGGAISKRKLFTDSEEVTLQLQRVIAVNGIEVVAKQMDLLDRCVLIETKRIPDSERKTDAELKKQFDQFLPQVLGACFDAIYKAQKLYNSVTLEKLPRMADFAQYGYCIAEAIQEGYGEKFLKEYDENTKQGIEEASHSNSLIESVMCFMRSKTEWTGSITELFKELQIQIKKSSIAFDENFPNSPSALSRKLNTFKSDLQTLGIEFAITPSKNFKRIRLLNQSPIEPEEASNAFIEIVD